ncbi:MULTISPECIES: hypothetical protein [Streptomyces]|uniref:hypothetical protein n=1 Tax=Streptomyces TaxID=1883 RepID=UPI00102293D1|nr:MULTISPECIES: hypothetical protein [Streptomyces]UKL05477.1 hypothetical protein L2I08_22250 [Streptomyces sp. NBU3104]
MPEPLAPRPEAMPGASCAVYVVEDSRGTVCYVGSVCRPYDMCGLASHIGEYIADLSMTGKWARVYVLPLGEDTPEADVRRIGGDIAGWLLPYDRERWPQAS